MQQAVLSEAGQRDQDIVELLQGGSFEAAFGRLAERYERKVYRLCCSMLRDPDQAADAAQESLLRVWKALPGYDQRASLSTWIYTITRNRCLTAIERRREHDSMSDPAIEQAAEAAGAAAAREAARWTRRRTTWRCCASWSMRCPSNSGAPDACSIMRNDRSLKSRRCSASPKAP